MKKNSPFTSLLIMLIIIVGFGALFIHYKPVGVIMSRYYTNHAIRQEKNGGDDLALASYNKAIHYNEKNVVAYYNRGLLNYKDKYYTNAIADLSKVIEYKGNYASVYDYRGVSYFYEDKGIAAKADFDSALVRQKDYRLAVFFRGLTQLNLLHDTASACTDLHKAKELGSENADAWLLLMNCHSN